MFRNNVFIKAIRTKITELEQRRLIYILSLVVGLLSALAAAILKNAIHYTHLFLSRGIHEGTGGYYYFVFPILGMLITVLFVKLTERQYRSRNKQNSLFNLKKEKSPKDA